MTNITNVFVLFNDMNLKTELLQGISKFGFAKPYAVQQCAIVPVCKEGRDLIAQSQRGTGKTVTIVLSTLQLLDETKEKENDVQTLVIAPTCERAKTVVKAMVAMWFCYKEGELLPYICVGEKSFREDQLKLEKGGIRIVVGVPGRVSELLKDRTLKPVKIKMLMLDDADKLLSGEIGKQIALVREGLPKEIQIASFSTKLPIDVLEAAKKLMRNPVQISINGTELNLEGIRQFYVEFDKEEEKCDYLNHLLGETTKTNVQILIFCASVEQVTELAHNLKQKGRSVPFVHTKMAKSQCDSVLREFNSGGSRVLISTHLPGIDSMPVVIIYNMPNERDEYLWRIRHSGRFGRKSAVINFVETNQDKQMLKEFNKYYSTNIEYLTADIMNVLNALF